MPGDRWERLASLGARPQKLLWASTTPKSPALPDTLYVDELVGPNTVTTLQEATIARFEDHGKVARTADRGIDEAVEVLARLAEVGIDMADVGTTLESQGLAAFERSVDGVLGMLTERREKLTVRSGTR
ncbi:MAG TPA: transaldolase family protein [Actinomycetota bacterium]|nr:transaldolase family protein [Actinomycetota bacterium]